MRITVLILGFGLGAVMFAQTFLIYGLSNITDDTDSGRAATAGIGMVLIWLLAVAFVFGVPRLSVALFLIAGAVGFANADHFPDLQVWGAASLILAGLSVVSLRQAKDKESRFPITVGARGTAERNICPNCGATAPSGTRFCSSCGQSLESLTCPSCTRAVAPNDAFCGHCGAGLSRNQYSDSNVESTQVEQPRKAARSRVSLGFAVCLFLLVQAAAWFRSAGAFDWGNYLGIVVVIGILGWVIFWVRKNGRGSLSLPKQIWTVLGVKEEPQSGSAATDSQSTQPFPIRVLAGMLVLAAVASFVASALDNRYLSIRVIGSGMEPTLMNGSLLRVELQAYDSRQPSRGDLIVYEDSSSSGQSTKRVVGLPGEHVSIENGVVEIDGQPLPEANVAAPTRCDADDECDVVLGGDELFVLGDNRPNSSDSRTFGPIDLSSVRGKITSVFWPPVLPWNRKPLT